MSEPIQIVLDGKTLAEVVRREHLKNARRGLTIRQRLRLIKRALTP